MKRIVLMMVLLISGFLTFAQSTLDSARTELYKVNKVFDSSLYLGFDVRITYTSDTLFGKFAHEEMNGTYLLNQRNIYYKMGKAEYVQNDSVVYNIYHDDKVILMTNTHTTVGSSVFPLRDFVDSILTWYDSAYLINVSTAGDYKVLSFTAKRDSLPYRRFAIYYDEDTYYPYRYEMKFFDGGDESDTVFLVTDSVQKQVVQKRPVTRNIDMYFSHYYNANSLDVFKDENYVLYDRFSNRFRTAEKYKGYKLIINGTDGEDYDKSEEITPPVPIIE
jgi:hypothetical protein